MNEDKDLATRVAEKKAEVERYAEILERYNNEGGWGRWANAGKRHLEELEAELKALENEYSLSIRTPQDL